MIYFQYKVLKAGIFCTLTSSSTKEGLETCYVLKTTPKFQYNSTIC